MSTVAATPYQKASMRCQTILQCKKNHKANLVMSTFLILDHIAKFTYTFTYPLILMPSFPKMERSMQMSFSRAISQVKENKNKNKKPGTSSSLHGLVKKRKHVGVGPQGRRESKRNLLAKGEVKGISLHRNSKCGILH